MEFGVALAPLDPEARKEQARSKTLRVDEIAQPNPYTKAEKSGQRPPDDVRPTKKRKFDQMVAEVQEGKRKVYKLADKSSPMAGRIYGAGVVSEKHDTSVKKTEDGIFDLWAEREEELAKHDEFVEKMGFDEDWYHPVKKPKLYATERTAEASKRSGRPAIEVDAPGTSYHPEYDSHQQLLADSLKFWTRKADKNKLEHSRMPRFKKSKEPEIVVESESDEDGEDVYHAPEDIITKEHVNLSHVPRKSEKERRKENRIKKEEYLRAVAQKKKEQNKTFAQLEQVVQGIDDESLVRAAQSEARKEIEELRKPTKIASLGGRYAAKEPEVLLSDELPGHFRGIVPKTSVLQDRFYSLQRRNMIPTANRPPKLHRVSKQTKTVEKHSYKDKD